MVRDEYVNVRYKPQATKSCVKHTNKHQNRSDEVEVYTRNLTESQRRRIHKQRAHDYNINEKQKARNLANLLVVTLLKVRVAAAIKTEFNSNKSSSMIIKLTKRIQVREILVNKCSRRSALPVCIHIC